MDSFYFDVINSFNKCAVEYMIVGGFAVNFHGYNRTTGDLDLWISNTDQNLATLKEALDNLGFILPQDAINELKADRIVTFSDEHCVIELLTRLNISKDVSFQKAYERSNLRELNGLNFRVISLADLKEEKARSKRYKDLDDLSKLEDAEVFYEKKSKEK